MVKDHLYELSKHLGSSKSWPLLLSILLRGLSGGRRVGRDCIFLNRFSVA